MKNKFTSPIAIRVYLVLAIVVMAVLIITGFTNVNQDEEEKTIPFERLGVTPTSEQVTEERALELVQAIFRDSVITQQDGVYHIVGDDKVGFDAVDNSPIREKSVRVHTLDLDVDSDGNTEIVALSEVLFLGRACTSCRTNFYITVFEFNADIYRLKSEQEFNSGDDDLFNSDIMIEEIQLLDVNDDNVMEILVQYQADEYLDPEKTKLAILQWQENQFRVIWEEVSHLNMDTDGRFQEKYKVNFDSTFAFAKTDEGYPDIVVDKEISKRGGVTLNPPAKEQIIYSWSIEDEKYNLVQNIKDDERS